MTHVKTAKAVRPSQIRSIVGTALKAPPQPTNHLEYQGDLYTRATADGDYISSFVLQHNQEFIVEETYFYTPQRGTSPADGRRAAIERALSSASLACVSVVEGENGIGLSAVNMQTHTVVGELLRAGDSPFYLLRRSQVSSESPVRRRALELIMQERTRRGTQLMEESREESRALREQATSIAYISTDGSCRRFHSASYAWVRDDFTFATGKADATESTGAEIRAIIEAILANRATAHKIVIRSDSTEAIKLAQDAIAGKASSSIRSISYQQARLFSGRHKLPPIEFEWVRGHNGDTMNELADRLAILDRRLRNGGLTSVIRERARAVVEEERLNATRLDAPAVS